MSSRHLEVSSPAQSSVRAAKMVAALAALLALAACTALSPSGSEPERQAAASSPSPSAAPEPPALPPPVDLAGRWRLKAAGAGFCSMDFGNAGGAAQGTIAPRGGCPGNFFTSRKWTFEHNVLIIRDHKGGALAQLSFSGGHFEGHEPNGATVSLSR